MVDDWNILLEEEDKKEEWEHEWTCTYCEF